VGSSGKIGRLCNDLRHLSLQVLRSRPLPLFWATGLLQARHFFKRFTERLLRFWGLVDLGLYIALRGSGKLVVYLGQYRFLKPFSFLFFPIIAWPDSRQTNPTVLNLPFHEGHFALRYEFWM